MASARNLCQHSDIDGIQCTSNDYILCPHCQLQLFIKQKQINIDDLNEMKNILDDIEKDLDELKQLLIDIYPDNTTMDIHIIKRRYSAFNDDDDDDNLWDTDDENEFDDKTKSSDDIQNFEELTNSTQNLLPISDIISLSSSISSPPTISSCSSSSITITKKAPLKFVIKRLQQPPTSTKIKYELHTVTTSSALRT
ncbi:unnamed protein product [Rotaria sp. Silwood2]|nr:unnamed protein product [Rotaria sp. Silwood2]CAF4685851.1 unnamed protein product [Rotaria sp. Silwood2]